MVLRTPATSFTFILLSVLHCCHFRAAGQVVATGWYHTCAADEVGALRCWGYNTFGQVGDSSYMTRFAPTPVGGLQDSVVAVAAGLYHSCALSSRGHTRCWGQNTLGQLGNADPTGASQIRPQLVSGLEATALAAGRMHTCALAVRGAVQCWGSNSFGQLGTAGVANSAVPLDVKLPEGALAIAAGGDHTCSINALGSVLCWGHNNVGQLGIGSTVASSTPVKVVKLPKEALFIAAGFQHTCGVLSDSSLWCWGANAAGQLGDGGRNNVEFAPVLVTALQGAPVARVAAGRQHTCAVLGAASVGAGGVVCWGDNDYLQLGVALKVSAQSPLASVPLQGLAVTVVTSDRHSCALLVGGAFQCWGRNHYGQLGLGMASPSSLAQEVFPNPAGSTGATSTFYPTERPATTTPSQVVIIGSEVSDRPVIRDGTLTVSLPLTVVAGVPGGLVGFCCLLAVARYLQLRCRAPTSGKVTLNVGAGGSVRARWHAENEENGKTHIVWKVPQLDIGQSQPDPGSQSDVSPANETHEAPAPSPRQSHTEWLRGSGDAEVVLPIAPRLPPESQEKPEASHYAAIFSRHPAYIVGNKVEYFSHTHQEWAPAVVAHLEFWKDEGATILYNLEVGSGRQQRTGVPLEEIRPVLQQGEEVELLQITQGGGAWHNATIYGKQTVPTKLGYRVHIPAPVGEDGANTTMSSMSPRSRFGDSGHGAVIDAVPPSRLRRRFPVGCQVEVYKGAELGWVLAVVVGEATPAGPSVRLPWVLVPVQFFTRVPSPAEIEAIKGQFAKHPAQAQEKSNVFRVHSSLLRRAQEQSRSKPDRTGRRHLLL